jgi:hypothetical protein
MIARLTKSRIQTYARSIALDGGVSSKWKENMSGADSGAKIRFAGVSFLWANSVRNNLILGICGLTTLQQAIFLRI